MLGKEASMHIKILVNEVTGAFYMRVNHPVLSPAEIQKCPHMTNKIFRLGPKRDNNRFRAKTQNKFKEVIAGSKKVRVERQPRYERS